MYKEERGIMEKLKKGDKLQIQCYKHDGKVHRCWDEAVLIDVKKDYMVFGVILQHLI